MDASDILEWNLTATLTELFNLIGFDRIKSRILEWKLIGEERMSEIEASKSREVQKLMLKVELLNLKLYTLENFVRFLSKMNQYERRMVLDQVAKFKALTIKKADKLREGKRIYSMKSKIRGPCIIIHNMIFGSIFSTRHGSDVNAEKLKNLFEQLHFKIHMGLNLTADGMKEFMIRAISQYETDKPECVFVIILTHGGRHHQCEMVFGVDNESISQNDLISLFNNKNAPILQSVPKVFIFDTCQGEQMDEGTLSSSSGEKVADDTFAASHGKKDEDGTLATHTTTACKEETGRKDARYKRMPTFTDMLIARASVRGFVSFRNTVTGSWFCNELVEVFAEHSHDTRLFDLLMMVNEKVSGRLTRDGERQCPTTEMLVWNKQLYFNPGFQE